MATSDSPKSITAARTLAVAKAGTPAPSSFVPMYKQDFAAGVVGSSDPDWRYSQFTDIRSVSGTQCVKMKPSHGALPPTCGGSHFFANNHGMNENAGLPDAVPIGRTVWYRMYFYFPSTFSFGYLFNSKPEAAECGKSADMGLSGIKWMNLSTDVPGQKVYTKIPSGYRKTAQPTAPDSEYPDIRIENEGGGAGLSGTGRPVPLNTWFAMQMAVKVANDGSGFVRLYLDDEMVAQQSNVSTIPSSVTEITRWGLGDYWNGMPYTDGDPSRDYFFIDEIIIASDMAGYGAPTGVDANGNAYIDPATRVGDFI